MPRDSTPFARPLPEHEGGPLSGGAAASGRVLALAAGGSRSGPSAYPCSAKVTVKPSVRIVKLLLGPRVASAAGAEPMTMGPKRFLEKGGPPGAPDMLQPLPHAR